MTDCSWEKVTQVRIRSPFLLRVSRLLRAHGGHPVWSAFCSPDEKWPSLPLSSSSPVSLELLAFSESPCFLVLDIPCLLFLPAWGDLVCPAQTRPFPSPLEPGPWLDPTAALPFCLSIRLSPLAPFPSLLACPNLFLLKE